MSHETTKRRIFFVILAICLLLVIHQTLAAVEPPVEGETLPSFELDVPQDAAAKSYLGLSEEGQFTVAQIEAPVVIIQIFSMY